MGVKLRPTSGLDIYLCAPDAALERITASRAWWDMCKGCADYARARRAHLRQGTPSEMRYDHAHDEAMVIQMREAAVDAAEKRGRSGCGATERRRCAGGVEASRRSAVYGGPRVEVAARRRGLFGEVLRGAGPWSGEETTPPE